MNLRTLLVLLIGGYGLTTGLAQAAEAPSIQTGPFSPDPASVTRFEQGYRYPRAGWIVLRIEGQPYERGYQHGRLLAAEIVDYLEAFAKNISPKAPHEAWQQTRTLVSALFLRRFDPEFLKEMKGIADGAAAAGAKFHDRSLDLIDIVALNSEMEIHRLPTALEATATGLEGLVFREPDVARPLARQEDRCSAFAATGPATADGKIVFGHITMSSLYSVRHFNVWVDMQPSKGHRVVYQGFPGCISSGLDYYMNSAGLLCSETTIRQTKFNIAGMSVASRIRRVMQYASTIDEAVEILKTDNNGLYTNEWLLADINTNEIAMFELGTEQTRLWRSSRDEWPGGTRGFYWGCNNVKDSAVKQETIASLNDKPANLVIFPHSRDRAWVKLFELRKGKIDAQFGFEAYSLPPLAAFRACDAKFTTTALAKDLKSWALFGPPRGRTWMPAQDELQKYDDIQPLVSNDWVLLDMTPPAAGQLSASQTVTGSPVANAVDLKPFPSPTKPLRPNDHVQHKAAWHGTLLPATDGDTWLAAAFADYEKIVSLERALHTPSPSGKSADDKLSTSQSTSQSAAGTLSAEAEELLQLTLFAPRTRWLSATRRLGHELPLDKTVFDWKNNEWYEIAAGKGVLLLAALRSELEAGEFEKLMEDFGRAHAGQKVRTSEFIEHVETATGRSWTAFFGKWMNGDPPVERDANVWSIFSFEEQQDQTLIIYGTLADRVAQKEAAELLQRKIARRFGNFSPRIVADTDVTSEELTGHHLLLIGRPATNLLASSAVRHLPVEFGTASFVVNGKRYANPDSAVIAAGENRHNRQYSAVVFAGLSAASTWHCIEEVPNREGALPNVILQPARMRTRLLYVPAAAK